MLNNRFKNMDCEDTAQVSLLYFECRLSIEFIQISGRGNIMNKILRLLLMIINFIFSSYT